MLDVFVAGKAVASLPVGSCVNMQQVITQSHARTSMSCRACLFKNAPRRLTDYISHALASPASLHNPDRALKPTSEPHGVMYHEPNLTVCQLVPVYR